MMEVWKKVQEATDYSVSCIGRVRNDETGHILKPAQDRYGYLRCILMSNSKRLSRLIHRLVAIQFIKNPKKKLQVNHIDGNKKNNNIENLEWVTGSENIRHSYKIGTHVGRPGIKHHNVKLTEIQVLEIIKLVEKNVPRKTIAKKYNIHKNHIYRLVCGSRWSVTTGRGK